MVIDVLGNLLKQLAADLIGGTVEDDDIDRHVILQEELADGVHRNTESPVFGIAKNTGGDQWEGHCFTPQCFCQHKALPITGNELLPLIAFAAVPHWAYRMYHILAGQAVCLCDLGISGRTAAQRPTLIKQFRPCCTMYATIHAAAAQEGFFCGVDDGIHGHFCNIIAYNFKRHCSQLPFSKSYYIALLPKQQVMVS